MLPKVNYICLKNQGPRGAVIEGNHLWYGWYLKSKRGTVPPGGVANEVDSAACFPYFIVPLCFCVNTWVLGFVLFFTSPSPFVGHKSQGLIHSSTCCTSTLKKGIGSRFLKCESVADCRKEVSQRQSDAGEKLQGEKKQSDHL